MLQRKLVRDRHRCSRPPKIFEHGWSCSLTSGVIVIAQINQNHRDLIMIMLQNRWFYVWIITVHGCSIQVSVMRSLRWIHHTSFRLTFCAIIYSYITSPPVPTHQSDTSTIDIFVVSCGLYKLECFMGCVFRTCLGWTVVASCTERNFETFERRENGNIPAPLHHFPVNEWLSLWVSCYAWRLGLQFRVWDSFICTWLWLGKPRSNFTEITPTNARPKSWASPGKILTIWVLKVIGNRFLEGEIRFDP